MLPPADYGGVERVVVWLAKGLIERGHEVYVAALRGSRLPSGVRLIEMSPGRVSAHDLLPCLPPGVDVVHFMAPPEAGAMQALPCASLLTVHGNGKPGERFPLNSLFLSRDHAHRHRSLAYVHNGIDPGEFVFDPKAHRANWALFLSKTSWRVKNVSGAIRICRRAGVGLRVAGGSRPWTSRWVVAATPGQGWLGSVHGEAKAKLLSEAGALIFPVLWSEPFGLVVIEALMSGAPVIATRGGSLPELVTPDVGLLLDAPFSKAGEANWVAQLREVWNQGPARRWAPEACRAHALTHFSHLKMAEAYESAYKKVIQGEALNPQEPSA